METPWWELVLMIVAVFAAGMLLVWLVGWITKPLEGPGRRLGRWLFADEDEQDGQDDRQDGNGTEGE